MSKATLTLETGEKLELNMQKGTLGYQTIDIQPFLKHKLFAYDPG
ncbi:TPA: citrate (Si)-synthase, partial [Mannheimia haemolytica]|nr:citrate (Si)-synthase [Mannheimia haemolytica]